EFARGGDTRIHPVPVDLDKTVADLLRIIEREFQVAGVKLSFEPGAAGIASIDVRRFRRVVLNLAQNARKALRRGGTLVVRTARAHAMVRIEFEDDGPGIPAEIRGRLFTPFTSAGTHGGTGLGLASPRRRSSSPPSSHSSQCPRLASLSRIRSSRARHRSPTC